MEHIDTQDQMPADSDSLEIAEPVIDELTKLKNRAEMMNIKFHPSISVDKLRAKINEHLNNDSPVAKEEDKPVEKVADQTEETAGQRRIRAKKEWPGQIFAVGNSNIGTFKRYVPFENEEGWHVEQIILDEIRAAQYQAFYTDKSKGGVAIRRGKLQKEFVVEVLPPLTEQERHDLAQRQAMAKSID
jgi:hypothetical protein